jgi:hypothetical protein
MPPDTDEMTPGEKLACVLLASIAALVVTLTILNLKSLLP